MRLVILTLAALLALAAPALADTAVSGPSGTIHDSTPSFRFSGEAGATFECKYEPAGQTVPWRVCTSPDGATLADGTYAFWVRATDRAGNVEADPPHRTFTIDTSAIDTAIDAGPDGLTNDPTPSFTFRTATTGATYECSLNGAAFALCSSPYTTPKLASGAYTLRVRAVSPQGKADATPAERAFTVDADAPDTRITGGPADHGETGEASPTITYASEPGAAFECRLDNTRSGDVDTQEFKPCPAAGWTATLAGGRHTFEVRAIDAAGNTDPTPDSRTFIVRVCEKTVRFGLIEATGDCLAQVGTEDAPKWESDADVAVNGLPLPVPGPAKVVLTGPSASSPGGALAVTDITLTVSGIQLYKGGFSWDLPAGNAGDEKELKRIDLAGKDQKLFGMKVEGFAALRLRRPPSAGGVYKTILQLHIALPELFKSGPQPGAGGVTGDVALNIDRDGVHADGLKVAVENAYVAGIGVKSVCLSYAAAGSSAVAPCAAPKIGPGASQPYIQCRNDNQQDRWDGALAIVLPTPSHTELGLWGGLRGGNLANAGGYADNLGTLVPLWPGAWLQSARLGICLDPPPFQIKGGVAVGLAPLSNGAPAVRIDGDFLYRAAYNDDPWLIRADGRLTLFDKQVASAYFQYLSSGMVDFGFDAHLVFGPAHIDGGVKGWIETVPPSRFNVQGDVNVCVDSVACLGGNAVISSIGAAACLKLSIASVPMLVKDADWVWWQPWKMHWENVPIAIEGGAGYTWQTQQTEVMVASCSIGKWVLAQAAQAGGDAVVVAKDQPAITVRLHGDGAPPKADLPGPGARGVAVPDRPGGALVQGSHMISEDPAQATTTIMIAHPAAGTWRVEPHAGSARVTAIDHADSRPQPTVVAGVGGKGRRRTLGYAYSPQPGQTITFVERGPKTAHTLGVAKPGVCKHAPRGARTVACGILRFAPARGGAGRRRIVAVITQDGRPRTPVEIAAYPAPADALPGRPVLLRARRAGSAVAVRWQPAAGFSYAAEAIVSDGRRLSFTANRGFRIPAVARGVSVRIAVRSLRDGIVGPAARVRVKATRRSPAVSPTGRKHR
jgi:hypothetical protein